MAARPATREVRTTGAPRPGRATQFPWDAEPDRTDQSYGPWILETDSCEAVTPPDWGGDPDAGGDGEPDP